MSKLIEMVDRVETFVYSNNKFWRSFNTNQEAWIELGKLVVDNPENDILPENTHMALIMYTNDGDIEVMSAGKVTDDGNTICYEELSGELFSDISTTIKDDWLLRRRNG